MNPVNRQTKRRTMVKTWPP